MLEMDIKHAILENIEHYSGVDLGKFAWDHREIIPRMHELEVVSENELISASRNYLLNQANMWYKHCAMKGFSPENLSIERHLAYGMGEALFSEKQLRKLKFDYGETIESFVRDHYDVDLPKKLAQDLINPKDPNEGIREIIIDDPHPVCLTCD